MRLESNGSSASGDLVDAALSTDAKGSFEFTGVQSGVELRICAAREGRGESELAIKPLVPGERRLQNLVVQTPALLKGLVTGSETGNPVVGVRVLVERDGETVAGVKTEADGAFKVQLNQPGQYFACPIYPPSGITEEYRLYGKTFRIEAGGEAELNLQMPDAVTMCGRAVDPEGQIVKDVECGICWVAEGGGTLGYDGQVSGVDGHFKWTAFPPGREGWFSVSKEGYVDSESSKRVGRPGEVLPEEDVVLYPVARLMGRLLGPDGEPLQDATNVRLAVQHPTCSRPPVWVTLGKGATFSLTKEVPAGSIELSFSTVAGEGAKEAMEWHAGPVDCRAGELLDLGELAPGPAMEVPAGR
jgi:hypothetical protein